MPFRSSSLQSRLMEHESDLTTPTKLFTFFNNPPGPNSKSNSPPLISPKTIPPRTSTSWWRPLTPVYEANAQVEVEDIRWRASAGFDYGLLADDRAVVKAFYGGRWGRARGRGAKWMKYRAILEMMALLAVVVFLAVLLVWAVRSMGRGRGMVYHYHSPELHQR